MGATTGRAGLGARIAVVVAVVLAIALLLLPDLPGLDDALTASVVGTAMSAVAASCAWWRALRSGGRRRYGWAVLGAASACTTVAGAIRSWFVSSGYVPFPSVADAAALSFGPLACVGLCLLPVHVSRERRLQAVLDAMATSWALALISWETALGAVVRATTGADEVFGGAVAVTYPSMDVVLLVFTALTLARAAPGTPRLPLGVLATGLVALCVSDSAYFFLAVSDGHPVPVVVYIGWVLGAGCLAMAPLLDDRDDVVPPPPSEPVLSNGGLLPYLPVVGVLVAVVAMQFNGRISTLGEEMAENGLVVLLLVRQYLTLRQNAELARRLAARERDLQHLAFHDPLTGLANRALFQDRLVHALDQHARERRPLGLLFFDLDGFKAVNDTLGHAAGDGLLVGVAQRVLAEARVADTVARLGGDEFAVLLERDDADRLATRIADALREPFPVAPRAVRVRASVGVVELAGHDPTPSADEILARADIAMYTSKRLAKRAGAPT
ncbi:GGDEF domain-containing protein [Pseudonocardia lacus]|uniref:GGDEF domain-containing protein n=1 Tax=Pseudonocardia lacus TaxID=2835865 RepID=UPI001BDCCC18|nr:GGDEF domain-containing protein [Pseudonocardia lacus]